MKTTNSPWARIPKAGNPAQGTEDASEEKSTQPKMERPSTKKRKTPRKSVGESAKRTMNVLKGIISPVGAKEALTAEERTKENEEIRTCLGKPREPSALGRECLSFLSELREENIRMGRSPDRIESHADLQKLEDVINLGGSHLKLAKGNWIQLDLGDKERNEILKEALVECGETINERLTKPSVGPAGFLKRIDSLLEILERNQTEKTQSRKLTNQARVLSWATMALLEIWEEGSEDPLEDATGKSTRGDRYGKEGVQLFKRLLLEQSLEEEPPTDTPRLSEKEMEDRLGLHGRRELTAAEAAYLAAVCAELELEKFKSSKKRETLFKMRAWMASRFYEVAKKHREAGHSKSDFILPQKPRYKTPCLFLARHKHHERTELVAIKPRENVAYWGNPESEKETYALVRVQQEEKKSLWEKLRPKPEMVKAKVLEYQVWIAWAAVLATALLFLGGILKSRKQRIITAPPAMAMEAADLSPASAPGTRSGIGTGASVGVEPLPDIAPTGKATSVEWGQ
jgi:hypothetical protein